MPGVEAWQCVCPLCGDVEDTVEHRMEVCVLAREAWRWTTQVLVAAGLGYTGGSMAFWLYGGSKQLQEERVVTTLRGAFFEAMPAAWQRVDEDGALTQVGVLADMMRARILTEIHRDALYVSEGYVAGYGEAEGAAQQDARAPPEPAAGPPAACQDPPVVVCHEAARDQ